MSSGEKKAKLTVVVTEEDRAKTAVIIGLGLIGGSFGLAMQNLQLFDRVLGVEANAIHAKKALELGLVHEVVDLDEAILRGSFIVLAIPVNAAEQMLSAILNMVNDSHTVIDAGSTKQSICKVAAAHPNGRFFVATHPMWGTEFSGPEAAVSGAFTGKAVVICNEENTSAESLQKAEDFYNALGMHLLYMPAADHDVHAAYVSHISHVTSFALANTVLEKEREDEAIFEMASGGFESTVRLAKSNPAMWLPIFMENRENVLDALNEHIAQLRKFKSCLEKENVSYLKELMENANKIKRILH